MRVFRDVHSQLVRSVGPTVEPMETTEVKSHLRESSSDENSLIDDLISAAREFVEADTELSLMPQTWILYLDRFPSDHIELRRPPITAVSSVAYVDEDGNSQTWASSNYTTDLVGFPGRVSRAYSTSWPLIRHQHNSVSVTFTAGYASASLVPALAKHAMLLLIGHWYENREAIGQILSKEIELSYTAITRRLKWDM